MINSVNVMSKVYSDFILEKQPTTVNETLQIFKDISKNFGNIENHYQYSSPMYAQLIPIKMVSILDSILGAIMRKLKLSLSQ